jgi:transglutaminase-like putative cysteine protease
MKTRTQALKDLSAAIAAYAGPSGPGTWTAEDFHGTGRPSIGLTYSVEIKGDGPEPHPEMIAGDEPWKVWGGDAILSAAGLENFDGMADTYTDKYGDQIYADSAVIEVSKE